MSTNLPSTTDEAKPRVRHEVRERREQAGRLFLLGWSKRKIAKQLKCRFSTVSRDVEIYTQELMESTNGPAVIAEALENLRQSRVMLRGLYTSAESEKTKADVAKALQSGALTLLQTLAPQRVIFDDRKDFQDMMSRLPQPEIPEVPEIDVTAYYPPEDEKDQIPAARERHLRDLEIRLKHEGQKKDIERMAKEWASSSESSGGEEVLQDAAQ